MPRKRNLLSLAILVGSLGAALTIDTTAWLARQEFKLASGIANPLLRDDTDGSRARVAEVAAAHPQDFDYAYVAVLRDNGPALTEDGVSVTPGSSTAIPANLEALKTRFPERPELYAHQLRYWSGGPLALGRRDPKRAGNAHYVEPGASVKAVWPRAEEAAVRGAKLAPENAYFPLMRSVALFAEGKDIEACKALHEAAQLPHYRDYVSHEGEALWKMNTAQYGGETGSLPKTAQMAAILFPHYASLRTAGRLATAEATRREQAGDTAGALQIRQDITLVGARMRDQGTSIITNLVGIGLINLAPEGHPGWVENKTSSLSEVDTKKMAIERTQRYLAYLKRIGAKDEARLYETENYAATETKRVIADSTRGEGGLDGLLISTVRATMAQGAGVLLLINMGWVLVFGAGAVVLGRTRGIQTGEGLPLSVHLSVWTAGMVAAAGMGILQVRSVIEMEKLSSMIVGTAPDGVGSTATRILPVVLLYMALSFPLPLLTMIGLAIWGKKRGERASVAAVKGLPTIALPVAAVVALLFAVTCIWTGIQEQNNLIVMRETLHGEAQYYAAMHGKEWPIVVQK
jgi:hypothetical protein